MVGRGWMGPWGLMGAGIWLSGVFHRICLFSRVCELTHPCSDELGNTGTQVILFDTKTRPVMIGVLSRVFR